MRLKIFNSALLTLRLAGVTVSLGWVLLSSQSALAQAPNISYSPSTNVLTVGNAFSITPGNTGGSVPTTGFGTVSTFAGSTSGTTGYTNGTGTAARFFFPNAVAIDASGTYYVTEDYDVRQITSGAVVTSIAGSMSGSTGSTNGTGSAARFFIPVGIATDGAGNLYIADESNNEIRKVVISTGVVTLLAGSTTAATGTTNGTGTTARFNSPIGIVYNPVDGALYVADNGNNQIRKVTTAGVVTLFAGSSSGTSGLTNGTGTAAAFNGPDGIAVDASGNLYVADQNNNEIRKITSAGVVSLVAGSTTGAAGTTDGTGTIATFDTPTGIVVDPSGNLYVSERGGTIHDIRFISALGQVVRVAGGSIGDVDGNGTAAEFDDPYLMAFDPTTGSLIIPDTHNASYRKMSTYGWFISPSTLPAGLAFDNTTGIISGTPTTAFSATTYTVYAVNSSGASSTTITLSAANMPPNISYSPSTNVLPVGTAFSITPANSGGVVPLNTLGLISTFAGSTAGTAGRTNATGTAALFNGPRGGAFDASGNYYVADNGNNEIRKITPAGVVTLLAGSSTGASGMTNGTGTAALFNFPVGVAADGAGNLYVTDYSNNEIRKIVISTGAVTLLAGSSSGAAGSANGTGTSATFNQPEGIVYNTVDGALYVTESNGNRVRKVTTAGVVTTFAGSGTAGTANGTGAAAQFFAPRSIAADASGNLYVADYGNNEIRKITTAAVVSLFAGSPTAASGSADGTGSAATFSSPLSVTVGVSGNLYVGDGTNIIRSITSAGVVTTIAGTGSIGYVDGGGLVAKFDRMEGITYNPANGTVLIGDDFNNVVREMSNYGYFITPTLPAGLSFDGTTGKISGTPTTTFAATTFTVTAYNQYGSSSTTITLSSGLPPNISYSPSTNVLPLGAPFSISPTNTGGAVPASIYGSVTTFAGNTSGTAGLTNGTGTAAQFNGPWGLYFDPSSSMLYVDDMNNNEVRKITSAGVVTLFAGSATGASGNTNGTGSGALFLSPGGITSDGAGNLYISAGSNSISSQTSNNDIRKIVMSTGVVSSFAGSGNGTTYGTTNGTGTAATFNVPFGISYNQSDDNLYVTDYYGNDVRKVTTGAVVSLFAGSPTQAFGSTNATGSAALFRNPLGVAVDASGNLYVCDVYNNQIRKITPAGVVTLFAGSATGAAGSADGTGSGATFSSPYGIVCDAAGDLYVMDAGNRIVRFITPAGVVTTVFGNGTAGFVDGVGTAAEFHSPTAGALDEAGGYLYVSEYRNNAIRKIGIYGYSITPSLPAGLSFDGTTGTISGTPATTFAATTFTVTAYNQYGSSATTITLSCVAYDWIGATSTDWATGSNWTTGTVPTSTSTARIGVVAYTGGQFQPTLSSSTTVALVMFGNLAPSAAPTLTIASGATLTATSGIAVNSSAGTVINGPGTLSLGNGAASSIASSGSLTLGPTAVLSLSGGTFTNSGTFVLGSDATGSASIAALPSGASISGTVTVQRYLTGGGGHRGYRLLSSPVYASTDPYSNKIYSINYLLNSTFLTGYGGTAGGFSQYGNPTLYLYRESLTNPTSNSFYSGNFRSINNISAAPNYTIDIDGGPYNIPIGNGYLFFFRGSTATVNPYTPTSTPVAATLSTSGTLNQGTITVADWFTPSVSTLSFTAASPAGIQGFNLLGNPYPCTINFEKFNRNGANSTIYGSSFATPATIYFFNPVTKQYCSYQQKSTVSSAADTTTSINPGISSDGYASNMIASGEGFFIKATTTGQTFRFTENAKVTTQPLTTSLGELMSTGVKSLPSARRSADLAGMSAATVTPPDPLLRLRLAKDSLNTDEVVIVFNNQDSTAYSPGKDALDLGGNGALESLSVLSSDSVNLSIYRTRLPGKVQETIHLLVDALLSGNYQLEKIQLNNLPKLYDVWLKDAFMKDSLEITANDIYSFTIDKTNPATFGTNRFSLVIRQDPALGVHLLNFTAVKATNGAQVGWVTENEDDYTGFTVERSSDNGTTFIDLGEITSSGLGTYGFLDTAPPATADQYRLKITDLNGAIIYSNIVTLIYGNGKGSLVTNTVSVYPNPASSIIDLMVAQNNVTSSNATTASYKIIITNSTGSIVKTAVSAGATWESNVGGFLPGTYVIQVMNMSNNSPVGTAKFIKI